MNKYINNKSNYQELSISYTELNNSKYDIIIECFKFNYKNGKKK